MQKINRKEYVFLKTLGRRWKWIARDKSFELWAYLEKPGKNLNNWDVDNIHELVRLNNDQFQFIQWEDEEPYNISDLIEGYEYWQRIAQNPTVAKLVGYRKESEEIEVKKDLEWARSIFENDLKWYSGVNDRTFIAKAEVFEYVLDKLDQLDEPEVNGQIDKLANFIMSEVEGEPSQNQGAVDTAIRIIKSYQNQETLSEEWISEKLIDTHVDTVNGEIQVTFILDDLQNLLVPKQEEQSAKIESVEEVVADFGRSLERLREVWRNME